MLVAELADAAMGAAEQILIEVEDRHIENFAELSFKTSRIGGYATQLIVGGDQGEPSADRLADAPKGRGGDHGSREGRRAGFELQSRHDFPLPSVSPFD